MKNILLISHSSSLTGAPILLHDIAKRLDNKKFRLSFVVGDSGPMVERFEKLGPTIVDELYPDELKYWREIKRLRKRVGLLQSLKPDLVFCNSIHTAKWLLYARMRGIPTITHVLELAQGFNTLSGLEHLVIRKLSKRIIAASEAVKQNLIETQGIAPEKITVVHAGVDASRFGKTEGARELKERLGLGNAVVIGTVGRITHVKGSDLFVELASQLMQVTALKGKVKFLVVATTADKVFYQRFRSMVAEHHLTNDFVIVEDIPDTASYFSAMDIYVTTAREDPFPVVILEAMASGKPVAGFATGGIPEAVTPECGVLVKGENVGALAKEMLVLISDHNLRGRFGLAGRRRVEAKFTLERYARDVETIINGMFNPPNP